MQRYTNSEKLSGLEWPILVLLIATALVALPLLGDGDIAYRLPFRATRLPLNEGSIPLVLQNVTSFAGDSCAVRRDGSLSCWDLATSGRGAGGDMPAEVVELAAGASFACARTRLTEGSLAVSCWGELPGTVAGDPYDAPRMMPGLVGDITSISAGASHACAVANGAVRCWGSNWYGELGTGSAGTPVAEPLAVSLSPDSGSTANVRKVAAGYFHTCALLDGGSVQCWGKGSAGQLGNGCIEVENAVPQAVQGLATGVVDLVAGGEHTCALLVDGRVQCWGANWWGQLGNGSTASQATPVFARVHNVTALSAGVGHTCAVTNVGAALCWGDSASGQLGDGADRDRLEPQLVPGLESGATGIAAGSHHTCVLMQDGVARCWGAGLR